MCGTRSRARTFTRLLDKKSRCVCANSIKINGIILIFKRISPFFLVIVARTSSNYFTASPCIIPTLGVDQLLGVDPSPFPYITPSPVLAAHFVMGSEVNMNQFFCRRRGRGYPSLAGGGRCPKRIHYTDKSILLRAKRNSLYIHRISNNFSGSHIDVAVACVWVWVFVPK